MSTRGWMHWRDRLGIVSIILLLAIWTIAPCFMGGEDEVEGKVPWLFVLGGGMAGGRLLIACQLFSQGHGRQGVVLTGGNVETFLADRAKFAQRCGIPKDFIKEWPTTANSFEEISAIAKFLATEPHTRVIVVSDTLHMSRLRYLRDRFALNGKVFFRQSHLSYNLDLAYIFHDVMFWYREPLAYVYYRIRYW